ncbi:hypothetical protein VRRI112168_15710 [Vreelandella rituensis]|uniref:Tetratricopeptide repeat protein n=2 Tax=Vreelandella rituensis TaxID=2282306 RepID=A0A368TPW1_9GAMM|nr:hypothetical protein DU506_17755 [Halomonas rituensis]
MAKKKRKGHQRGKSPSIPHHKDSETLTQQAQQALQDGRFREAIAHFKALLKQEDTVQVRQRLAQAYEGRAIALADKGMDKEALVIWHNRHALGADVAPVRLPYADVLLRLGKAKEVVALLDDGVDVLSHAERDKLRAKLAAHSLAGDTGIRDTLPDDDPLHAHLTAAETALDAYCNGDDDTLTQALAAIPFRSPCRDLAQILKALQRLGEAPEEAKKRLAKVADDSAFSLLRQAAELACLPESAISNHLQEVGETTRRFVLTLRGWDQTRQTMQQALHRLGPAPSHRALLKLMYRHQQTLGKTWVDEYALRLLVEKFPDSVEWLRQHRPVKPPDYDLLRLVTWYLEGSKSDPWDILDGLEKLADELQSWLPITPGSDHALRIALTLKRTDALFHVLDETPSKDPECLDSLVAAQIEESLKYDPDDPEAYLRLHGYYLRGKQLKQARRFQEAALSRWADDVRVLTAALDTAVDSQAFKKAAKLAHQILAIDPINRSARDRLVKAHLAHAAKQLRASRPDLADNELTEATRWDTQERFGERHDIIAALIEAQRNPAIGAARLAEVYKRQGSGLAAHFNMAMELEAAGIPPAQIGQRFGIKKPHVQGTADIEAFVARLQVQLAAGKLPDTIKRHFEMPVKTAAHFPMTFDAMLQLCELLKRCDWQAPRLAVAREGVKQWKAPIFELHAFEAKYPKKPWLANDKELHRLNAAEERATDAGDIRTATRLSEILAPFRFLGGPTMAFHEDEEEIDSPFRQASEEDAVLADLRERGLEALCDELGLDAKVRKILRAMNRDFGLEAVAGFMCDVQIITREDKS